MKYARKKRLHEVAELNTTAFMDLMVALLSFLLISAVFTRMTVVELNLPQLNAKANPEQEIKLSLQLVVHKDAFDLRDANLGTIKKIARNVESPDWKTFTNTLLEIKYRFPNEENITLLFEPGVNYKTMIEVMDHVRTTDVINTGTLETVELFPNISIGDAPDIHAEQSDSVIDDATQIESAIPTGEKHD